MALNREDKADVKGAMGKAIANKVAKVTRDGTKKLKVKDESTPSYAYHDYRGGKTKMKLESKPRLGWLTAESMSRLKKTDPKVHKSVVAARKRGDDPRHWVD